MTAYQLAVFSVAVVDQAGADSEATPSHRNHLAEGFQRHGALGTAALLSLAGLGLLLLCAAGRPEGHPPLHGMLGQLCSYQIVAGLILVSFAAALVGGRPAGPVLFAAVAATLLFLLVAWRWLMPAGAIARRAGNVLSSVALFVVLLEGTLFAASYFVAHPLLVPVDPDSEARVAAWRLRPGSVWMGKKVNQRGFCDDDRPRRKPPGVFRIVVLADSFGIGFVPYENNFIRLLEEKLNADSHAARRYEVVNLSVPSIGPAEYHWLLVNEALPLDPDLVICCVFTGNDFTDNAPAALGLFDDESYATFRVLRRALAVFQNRQRVAEASTQAIGRQFSRDEYFRLERAGLQICLRESSRPLYDRALGELDRMASLISDRLLLFVIPREYQVNDPWWQELMASDRAPERYDRELPNRVLREFCSERGIPCADPLEALRQSPGPTYLPRDTHWNVAGNRIGADVLAREVRSLLRRAADDSANLPPS